MPSPPTDSRPLVKVCGLTDPAEARACVEAGATWIGLNFHPPSPRFVEEARATEIVAALDAASRAVGLFVNRDPREVRAVARRVGLGAVQLHGDEPPEDLRELGGLFLIRAFRLGAAGDIDALLGFLDRADRVGRTPDAILIDAKVEGRFGGTGRTVAGDLLDRLPARAAGFPPLILAGGLTPENVADRVARCRPWMVDVAGGVEAAPGRKDPARVAAFVRAARSG